MKFTVGGHEYSVEWLAICTGLFLSCTWLLVLSFIRAGEIRASDLVVEVALFGVGFSAVELVGAWEIFWLWHDETDALRAEAWRRYNLANWEAKQIGKGNVTESHQTETVHIPREMIIRDRGRERVEIVEDEVDRHVGSWGKAIIWLLAHGLHNDQDGNGMQSKNLVGSGRAVSQTDHWVAITNEAEKLGILSKGPEGTKMLMEYGMAVEQVFPRLRQIELTKSKPPKVTPPPQGALDKIRHSKHKTENIGNG